MPPSTPHSISIRLRRVTTECTHVRVPVTELVMREGIAADGYRRLDMEKLMAAAVELGLNASTSWEPELHREVIPHPVQTPPSDEVTPRQ